MTKVTFESLHEEGDKAQEITKDSEERSSKEYLACLFLTKSDNIRLSELKKLLTNDGLKGDVNYPTDIDTAHTLLKGYKQIGGTQERRSHTQDNAAEHLTFAQPR